MEVSGEDIARLVGTGYCRNEFSVTDGNTVRLRNIDGRCYFYDVKSGKCRVYRKRPLGCRLYPIVYLLGEGAVVDDFCPMGHTISEKELRRKAPTLSTLINKMDDEKKKRI
jgi:Fe-S-cluster containining protein